jgi:hypothetical protein
VLAARPIGSYPFEQMKRLFLLGLVIIAVVASAQTPAIDRPVVRLGPSRPISAPVPSNTPFPQIEPAASGSGDQFLVVWNDARPQSNGAAIMASRIDSNGNVLDPYGILLGPAVGPAPMVESPTQPQVIALSDLYLVIWDHGGTVVSRVASDGLDAEPRPLTVRSFITAATDGERTLVVTNEWWTGKTFGIFLDRRGEVLDEFLLRSTQIGRSATAAGGTFLLVANSRVDPVHCGGYRYCDTTTTEQISKSGASLAYAIQSFHFDHRYSDMASDGADRFLFVYVHQATNTVMARLFTADGQVSPDIPLDQPANGFLRKPDVIWNGDHFLISWSQPLDAQTSELRLVRVDREGSVFERGVISIDTPGSPLQPTVAVGDGRLLLAWEQRVPEVSGPKIIAKLLHLSGSPRGEESLVSGSPASQERPVLAMSEALGLVSWLEHLPNGTRVLKAKRLSRQGVPLGEREIEIDRQGGWSPPQTALASDGESCLIVWSKEQRLLTRLLRADGEWAGAINELGLDVCGLSQQGLIWNGSSYFLVRGKCNPPGTQVVGLHLDRNGYAQSPEIYIASQYAASPPVIAFNGTMYLVAWSRTPWGPCANCVSPPPPMLTRVARITRDGTVLDPEGISLTKQGGREAVSLAWGGDVFLVTWAGSNHEVRGTRFSTDGRMLDGDVQSDGVEFPFAPWSVPAGTAWDGNLFVVFWHSPTSIARARLHASHFDPEQFLAAQMPSPVVISEEFGRGASLYMTSSQLIGRDLLIAYERVPTEREWGGVRRIFTRAMLGSPPRGRISPRK